MMGDFLEQKDEHMTQKVPSTALPTTVPTSHCGRKGVGKLVNILCLGSFHILMPFEDDLHGTLSWEKLMNLAGSPNPGNLPEVRITVCGCELQGQSTLERRAGSECRGTEVSTAGVNQHDPWGCDPTFSVARRQAAHAKPAACLLKFHPIASNCIYHSLKPRCFAHFPQLGPWSLHQGKYNTVFLLPYPEYTPQWPQAHRLNCKGRIRRTER